MYNDCAAALAALHREPQFNDRRLWDHWPEDDWILHRWVQETCTIAVVVETLRASDEFSLLLVECYAEMVNEECVREGNHRGGNVRIGVKQLFHVAVVRTGLFDLEIGEKGLARG